MKNFLKILLGVLLAATVCIAAYPIFVTASQGTQEALEAAISLNLYWGYFLLAVVIAGALFSAVYGMIKSSKGLLKTVLSFVGIIVIVVGAYFIAAGHTIEIPNIEKGGSFEHFDTVITETSVLIAYVAMAGAIIAALASEVMGAFK